MRPLNGPSIKVQRIGTRKDKAGTQTGKRNIIVLSIRPAAVRRSLITTARSHLPRAQRGGNHQAGRPPMSITQSKCMTRFGRGVDALAAACANARVQNFDRHETSLPARSAPSHCAILLPLSCPSVRVCPSSICWLRPRPPSFLPSGLTSNPATPSPSPHSIAARQRVSLGRIASGSDTLSLAVAAAAASTADSRGATAAMVILEMDRGRGARVSRMVTALMQHQHHSGRPLLHLLCYVTHAPKGVLCPTKYVHLLYSGGELIWMGASALTAA